MINEFYKGDDIIFLFELQDDDEVILPSSAITDTILIFTVDNSPVIKFKRVASPGFKSWDIDPNNAEITIKMLDTETKLFPEGKLRVEITIVFVDTSFTSGKRNLSTIFEIGSINKTKYSKLI